jgi:hypothetical protein
LPEGKRHLLDRDGIVQPKPMGGVVAAEPKEAAMRANRFTLSAIALIAGIGVAAAQQQIPANQATNPIGDGPFKSQQGGKEEPSSHASGTNKDAVFVDGKLNVPGAPPDGQTVPSKFSTRNASLDQEPLIPGQKKN